METRTGGNCAAEPSRRPGDEAKRAWASPAAAGRSILGRLCSWDAAFLGILLLLTFKVVVGTSVANDIRLADETRYLAATFAETLPPAAMSPLYICWYRFLSWFAPDTVSLYYLNWVVLTATLAGGVYMLARTLGATIPLAFLGGTLVLFSRIYFVWPRPMHFAASLMLFGLALAISRRSIPAKLAMATLTAGAGAYARPEFAVSFVFLATVLIAVLCREAWREPRLMARWFGLAALSLVPVALLFYSLGNPLGGARSHVAFGQHYAVNKWKAGLIPETRSPSHNYAVIIEEDFGGSEMTPLRAWRADSANFRWHLSMNIGNLVPHLWQTFQFHRADEITPLVRGCLVLLFIAALAGAAIGLRSQFVNKSLIEGLTPVLILLAMIAPILAACLVIYPRAHYLVCLVVLLLACSAALAARITAFARWTPPLASFALIALAVAVLAPNQSMGWSLGRLTDETSVANMTKAMPCRQAIRRIQDIPFDADLRVLELGYSRFVYSDHDFEFHSYTEIGEESFTSFLSDKMINVIVFNPADLGVDRIHDDPEYAKFRDDPPPGWVAVSKPDFPYKIVVRRDALAESVGNIAIAPAETRRL